MATTSHYFRLRRHGEGHAVVRYTVCGDETRQAIVRTFPQDSYGEATAYLRGLTECEPLEQVRQALLARVRQSMSLERMEDALKALTTIAPQYDCGAPYRPVNPDLRPVPAEAVAALDTHLLDEEVA